MGIDEYEAWELDPRSVCTTCLDDYGLVVTIGTAADADAECSFCGRSGAASIGVLVEAMLRGWDLEYERAIENTTWDSSEGGYVYLGPHWDTHDLVLDVWGDAFAADGLGEAVASLVGDEIWVERDFAMPRQDIALRDAWSKLTYAVKHVTRYVFWQTKREQEEWGYVAPQEILDTVGRLTDALSLVTDIGTDLDLWRAHSEDSGTREWNASRMGTAPTSLAKSSNRMSPAGIPMFYAAFDAATAEAEVRATTGREACLRMGRFRSSAPLAVLDLTKIPPIPSLFDEQLAPLRRPISFLRAFAEEISTPVGDGAPEIEYVPTQVVTEYFLHVYADREDGRRPLDGIIYTSAQGDGVCIVLNIPNERCVDDLCGETEHGLACLVLNGVTLIQGAPR